MKTSIEQILKSRAKDLMPAVLFAAALLFYVMPVRAHDRDDDGRDKDRHGDKPEIVDPDDRYRGKTYGEWAAAMLQWVFSVPTEQNAITDTTGAFADVGQSGPVFFLPGNLGGTTVREVTVPEGKALFIGLLGYVWVQFPDDPIYTIDELREMIAPFQDNPRLLTCEIDGKKVRNLRRYRAQSPVFSVTVPAGNLLELDPGTYAPCVDDGYYLLVEPLSRGRHTIRFAAESNDGFSLDVTYHIEVVGPTEIVRPDRRYFGKTYGQWAAAWWQWALSVPAVQNPLTDPTGEFAGIGQSGPVWFLAGTLGNSAQRTVTFPAGKPIFMPVHNWIFGSGVSDCDPTAPGVTCDVAELRAKAAAAATGAEVVEAWIDGEKVRNIRSYRGISPEPFSITLPNDPVIDVPAGTYYPQVADGYWLMLTPPDKGRHTIRVRVVNSAFGIDQYFGIELNVIKPGKVVPPTQR